VTRILSHTEQILAEHSTPVANVPWLFNFHGSGLMFHGIGLHDRDLGELYARTHWFTLAFVPILPLGVYMIEKDAEKTKWWRSAIIVHRKLKFSGVVSVWGLAEAVWLITSAWLITFGVLFAIGAFLALGEYDGWWRL